MIVLHTQIKVCGVLFIIILLKCSTETQCKCFLGLEDGQDGYESDPLFLFWKIA